MSRDYRAAFTDEFCQLGKCLKGDANEKRLGRLAMKKDCDSSKS